MAEMSREIMSRMDKLDICEHGKERQDCDKCRKPSLASLFPIAGSPQAEALEKALADIKAKEKALAESETK